MYPLCRIIGNESAKIALILLAVDPAIGSVLILGERGSGKTRIASSVESLGIRVVKCPSNVTEEQLCSQVDLEKTVASGRLTLSPGLLERSSGRIVLVDDIQRMNVKMLQLLTETGRIFYDPRHAGISDAADALDYGVVATMLESEAQNPGGVIDRFAVVVRTEPVTALDSRIELIDANIRYDENPLGFEAESEPDRRALAAAVGKARDILREVHIPFPIKESAARLCGERGTVGNVFEQSLIQVARAHAAWKGRSLVYDEDLRLAARLVLDNREFAAAPEMPFTPPAAPPPANPEKRDADDREQPDDPAAPEENGESGDSEDSGTGDPPRAEPERPDPPEPERDSDESDAPKEEVFAIGEGEIPVLVERRGRFKTDFLGVGRKEKAITQDQTGRKVRTRPTDTWEDIDLFSTVMQAAPHQRQRRAGADGPLVIRRADLRRKVRERGVGRHVLILIDSSGSLSAGRRMSAVKGSVMRLLRESYVRRDQVGLIAFRSDRAEVILPLTRSLTLARKKLEFLPTGGNTPLGLGIEKLADCVRAARIKQPDALFRLYVISDGRANRSFSDRTPVREAADAAAKLRIPGASVCFIDYEKERFPLRIMQELAEISGGAYYKVSEITEDAMDRIVRRE